MNRMDDLISRQAAIDELDKGAWGVEWDKTLAKAMIESFPPAEPKRIRGKWIKHEHGYWTFVNADGERDGWIPDYECDQCGSRGWKYPVVMNFCPNCGADMRGEQDE